MNKLGDPALNLRSHNLVVKVKVAQSCSALCDPKNYSPSGSSVHGILQTRILEWVVIPFSRGSSDPEVELCSPTLQADSLLSVPPKKPQQSSGKDREEKGILWWSSG